MRNTAMYLPKISALFFLMILCAYAANVNAQTTWDGSESTDWFDADNWSAGIPDASDDVTIPDMMPNNPEIGSAGAVAKSVDVNTGASLTIGATGILSIDGSDVFGIDNHGTINNGGTINIGNTTLVSGDGIRNRSLFNNNTGGVINIDRCQDRGLRNYSAGTFNNEATITIGATASAGDDGMLNSGIFNNNTGGEINVDRSILREVFNQSMATFNNEATINIGATIGGAEVGLRNSGEFNNDTGGEINIDRSTLREIINQNLGTFNNAATINIGSIAGGAENGIRNDGNFNNNTGGEINIDRSTLQGLNNTDGVFTNEATLNIGSNASIGETGILNEATINNNTGGVIKVDSSTIAGCSNTSTGNLTNNASINIGQSTLIGYYGINNAGSLTNSAGSILISRMDSFAVNNESSGIITNFATIEAAIIAGIYSQSVLNNRGTINNNSSGVFDLQGSNYSIYNRSSGTINNYGNINGNTDILLGFNYGTINNYSGASFILEESWYEGFFNFSGSTFYNEGTVNLQCQRTPLHVNNGSTFNNNGGLASFSGNQAIWIPGGTIENTGIINAEANSNFHPGIGGHANVTNSATGILNITGGGGVNKEGFNVRSLTNYGEINIDGNWEIGISFNSPNNENSFNHSGGSIEISGVDIAIEFASGDPTFLNESTITVDGNTSLLIGASGTFTNSTGGTLTGQGDLVASRFESSGGTLAPGNSPGIMTFDGDEDFSNSVFSIEIDGTTTAGVDYDQVVVNGTATLGGTLHLIEGYTPVNGDQVIILDATSLSGTFSGVTGATNWFVNYDAPSAGDITLSFGAPLPVELTRFIVRKMNDSVLLEWSTASELNNKGFDIERSIDGLNWESIGFAPGNGTTHSENQYSFLDKSPLPGINYYRLRQIDFDGQSTFSLIKSIYFTRLENEVNVYPNPAFNKINLSFENEFENCNIELFDPIGNRLMFEKINGSSDSHALLVSDIPSGLYLLKIQVDGKEFLRKIQIN